MGKLPLEVSLSETELWVPTKADTKGGTHRKWESSPNTRRVSSLHISTLGHRSAGLIRESAYGRGAELPKPQALQCQSPEHVKVPTTWAKS